MIPVGEFYTGSFNRLFFVKCDHDRYPRKWQQLFPEHPIYDGDSCGTSAVVWLGTLCRKKIANPYAGDIPQSNQDWITLNFLSPSRAGVHSLLLTGQLVLEQNWCTARRQPRIAGRIRPSSGTYVLKVLLGETQIIEKLTVVKN